jgi:hypothetical protein
MKRPVQSLVILLCAALAACGGERVITKTVTVSRPERSLAPCPPDGVGEERIQIRPLEGEVVCEEAAALWRSYLKAPGGEGSSGLKKIDGWVCQSGRIADVPHGSCSRDGVGSFSSYSRRPGVPAPCATQRYRAQRLDIVPVHGRVDCTRALKTWARWVEGQFRDEEQAARGWTCVQSTPGSSELGGCESDLPAQQQFDVFLRLL